jgi:energy-coupling factor transporter ATP-binding protein EcfA2
MIENIELNNFTVFSKLKLDFSPRINVIIGENGTGKTHFLKAAYAVCSGNEQLKGNPEVPISDIESALTTKLVRLFLPLDNKLGKIHRHGAREKARLSASFSSDKSVTITFSNRASSVSVQNPDFYERYSWVPVFIPTKEVLSLLPGFAMADREHPILSTLFDDTYLDLCQFLLKPTTYDTEERIYRDPKFGTIYPSITSMIGGKYEFQGGNIHFKGGTYKERKVRAGTKVNDKPDVFFSPKKDKAVSINMTAEGFRKLGIVQQLLQNRSLQPGVSGPLFWDEPESNVNPLLMKFVVETLLILARNGQQIILATHDYVLLKWLDLLADKGQDDHIRYHCLYRDTDSSAVEVSSTDDYLKIAPNPLDDAFSQLIDQQISNEMGGLGK